jgi:hypothetical protein
LLLHQKKQHHGTRRQNAPLGNSTAERRQPDNGTARAVRTNGLGHHGKRGNRRRQLAKPFEPRLVVLFLLLEVRSVQGLVLLVGFVVGLVGLLQGRNLWACVCGASDGPRLFGSMCRAMQRRLL